MENSYESGFAFVLEGATERVFYERLLYFFARKHPNCYNNNSDYLQKARKYGHFTGYKN